MTPLFELSAARTSMVNDYSKSESPSKSIETKNLSDCSQSASGSRLFVKRCLRVYRVEFAMTQLLDLTVWVGLSAARTSMVHDYSKSESPIKSIETKNL